MSFDEMIKEPASWLSGSGEEAEIILSSRVRLARNLENRRFTHNSRKEELSEILEEARSAARGTKTFEKSFYFPMGSISSLNRQFLAERHLVSPEFLASSSNRGLVVNSGEDVCLMINEEDHLRLQAFTSGLDIPGAFSKVNRLDNELSPKMDFAFSERLGFLTACPTNLGTGLRASVLIHLPGLVHSKEINKLLESLRKVHHSIRGLYGEGTESMGNFFQISNSTTLGVEESAILNNLKEMVSTVVGYEKKARGMLFQKARSLLEDKVWRAYGLLRYARRVDTKEALSLISAVRLGVGMGIVSDVTFKRLNELLVYIQPAHLQMRIGKAMDHQERDVVRANYIRQIMSEPEKDQEE